MTDPLAASVLARAAGLALVEFLWQGAAIGVATAGVLVALRRTTAQARYIVACAGLTLMAAMPVVTTMNHLDAGVVPRSAAGPFGSPPPSADTSLGLEGVAPPARQAVFSSEWLEPRLSLVMWLWSGGVLAVGLHLCHGWLRIGRIRRRATTFASNHWPETVRILACRLGITRPVRIVESVLVDVPAVIGFLRPAIVVPASALAGLSPAHFEAILAHELAHIRRADYLINAMQCVIEVLLFYHPAVWWVSEQIRIEREHCCDDVAAKVCGDRLTYAHALVSLEELRGCAPAFAMAATGGHLLSRIRRLLDPGSTRGPQVSGGFAMTVMLMVVLFAVSGHVDGTPAAPTLAALERPAVIAPAPPLPQGTARPPRDPRTVTSTSQTARGRVSGTVRDQDGGVLVAVPVTTTAVSSGDRRTTQTDGRGEFVLSDLAPGTYDVTITKVGFKTFNARLTIVSNESVRTTVQLEIGSLSETISVRGLPGARPSSPAPIAQASSDARTAADYFDAAKLYYQQGRLADAEAMTLRALALLRAATPESPTQLPAIRSLLEQSVPDPGGPIRVGGDVKPPVRITYVEPKYPQIALTAGVEGVVFIEARVGKDGSVSDAKILRGIPLLNDAALDAVRQWVYTPTELNGVPVEIVMTVTVNFKMQ